jgi:glycosyltransferase involved in cell wall biosynthesis
MTKKRVFFLIPSLSVGGAEITLINLLASLDKSRYDITLCAVLGKGELEKKISSDISYISLTNRKWFPRFSNYMYLKFNSIIGIRLLMSKVLDVNTPFDFGVCFQNGIYTDYLLSIKNQFGSIFTVVQNTVGITKKSTHYSRKYLNYSDKLRKRYSQIDKIICVSESAKKAFVDLYGYKDKAIVIHNALNLEKVRIMAEEKLSSEYETYFDTSKLIISVLGRIEAVKNHKLVIELADHLVRNLSINDFRFIIIGSGPLLESLKAHVDEKKLNEYVYFLGFVKNPYPLIKASSVYIQPSITEGLPTTLCEALAMGKPVITSDIPPFNEVLCNGKFGLISKNNTIFSYADNLMKMFDNSVRESFSLKASERWDDFSTSKTIEGYDNLFR